MPDRRALWAVAEMERHLGEIDTGMLAAGVNLSRSRFAHLFTRELGTSPARYLHRLRMERARMLLQRTFLTVGQVKTQVGLRDASHFSRDFKRYHGVAPRDARRAPAADGHSEFLQRHFALIEAATSATAFAADAALPAIRHDNH